MFKIKTTCSYTIAYPDPLILQPGEKVNIIKSENAESDWFGWHFCKDKNGKDGWISKDYMDVEGSKGEISKSYSAKELDATEGEEFEIIYSSCGWSWCKNSSNEEGWLPDNIFEKVGNNE